jgi:hypothetical protein
MTKKQAVINFILANPMANNHEVIERLAKQGLSVSYATVAVTRSQGRKEGLLPNHRLPLGRPVSSNGATGQLAQRINSARAFVSECGSLSDAKLLLEALEDFITVRV